MTWMLCLTLALTIITTACGIDTVGYIDKPLYVDTLMFRHEPINLGRSSYLGLNLYYRIYSTEVDAETDKQAFETRQSGQIVEGTAIQYLTSATGLNYRLAYTAVISPEEETVVSIDNLTFLDPPPTIDKASAASLISVYLNSSSQQIFALLSGALPAGKLAILRNASTPLLFSTRPIQGDPDFQQKGDNESRVFVQLFISSYGMDTNLIDLHSNALYLGRLEIQY